MAPCQGPQGADGLVFLTVRAFLAWESVQLASGLGGFCGSTDDFCGTGCQKEYGGCGEPKRPECAITSGRNKRVVGYYESWASTRACQRVNPEDLDVGGYTHINFAFAFFDPVDYRIAPMGGHSEDLFARFTALKNGNPGLQTWISIGGWSFTDPGPTRTAFSEMVSSEGRRRKFIMEVMHFMRYYGFDGVDLDWEYPQADDRGGAPDDKENYAMLVLEMRSAFGSEFGITMTIPASYWYLQHYDFHNMEGLVDWFNLMSYDIHGTWDKDSKFVGPYIAPHTNVTEIDMGLDLLWRARVPPSKVVMGMAFYGRSFRLKDPACNQPNGQCEFVYENGMGAAPGPCSKASGILNLAEIQDIVYENNLTPYWDQKAMVKWITWDQDQWVSYDDEDTLRGKRDFAQYRCLGGYMVWAMDQVDTKTNPHISDALGLTSAQRKIAAQLRANQKAQEICYTTECGESCAQGTNPVETLIGQTSSIPTGDEDFCPDYQVRTLCCADGTTVGMCRWEGYRGLALPCYSGCRQDEIELVKSSSFLAGKSEYICSGNSFASFCCSGFRPPPLNANSAIGSDSDSSGDGTSAELDDLGAKLGDAAKGMAMSAAENEALDLAAKAFCRIAVPLLEAGLDAVEGFVPILGEIAIGLETAAEVFLTPALIQACTKLVEVEGKAIVKMLENLAKPKRVTKKPTSTRPPESSHTSGKPRTTSCNVKRAGVAGDDDCRKRKVRRTRTTSIVDDTRAAPTATMTLNCAKYPQPCWHYSSVARYNPGDEFVTCQYKEQSDRDRPAVDEYDRERDRNKLPANCDADEWPPAYFADFNNGLAFLEGNSDHGAARPQFIRAVDSGENQAAGRLFRGKCAKKAPSRDIDTAYSDEPPKNGGGLWTQWVLVKAVFTRQVYSVSWSGLVDPGDGDDGLKINRCQPNFGDGKDHRGFALLNRDSWFDRNPWAKDYTAMYNPQKKRGVDVHPDDIVVIEANSSRRATDTELKRYFGLVRCSDDCSSEMQEIDLEATSAVIVAPPKTQPHPTYAETTSGSLITDASPSATKLDYFATPTATNLARET
ncbi:hypothetical protein Aspvir_005399 [Aspergillus viridinutans]|uniref:chitinase n=1 Tax=Aspergillus viridinutans TaxID=75553 RepID=A0A9P3BS93_ASPVI|nr:uncharacterized protein Aspvir_005399 [Aspergillus viridinutans]GIK01365.1 hypothetical protein Aspvir_005399 [Aspergillus viridinutans]